MINKPCNLLSFCGHIGFVLMFFAFIVVFQSCEKSKKNGATAKKAMVVSARKEASDIGAKILKKGGNAFDAMVATELALAVAYPIAGNIGGGGFMVYRLADGTCGSIDYREKAPLGATKTMYLDKNGNVVPYKSTLGATAVGIPGTIAGIFEVHKKFGILDIKTIIEPVIELAKRGVVVTEHDLKSFKTYSDELVQINGDSIPFNKNLKVGDTIKYLALAKTLERIAKNGPDEFYSGETAQKLVQFLQKKGGLITLADLKCYKAKWRDPLVFQYKNLKIISMSPPSSGGICLGSIMTMISEFPIREYGHNQPKTIQLVVEAERRAYADRSYYLGDPDFVKIPTASLLDVGYLKKRMSDFSFEKATPSKAVSHGDITFSNTESSETTHYSIVDSFGNAVAATTTLNDNFGSKLYSFELGFLLNNEMDDFSIKPGFPNIYGLVGSEANSIAPEKRMLSSMTPTIIEKSGKLFMVVGTPGGSTIITSVLQTILNVYEFGMTMQEAVGAPRFHHQWLPDKIYLERDKFSKNTIDALKTKGYAIGEDEWRVIGKVDAILINANATLEGGADPRGDDAASGF